MAFLANWRVIGIAVLVAGLFFAGYKVGTWHADAKAKAAQEEAVADFIAGQKKAQAEAAELEADKAKITVAQSKTNKAREKDVKAHPGNYAGGPTPVGLSLINDALTGSATR